jgi:hypothetical protein
MPEDSGRMAQRRPSETRAECGGRLLRRGYARPTAVRERSVGHRRIAFGDIDTRHIVLAHQEIGLTESVA